MFVLRTLSSHMLQPPEYEGFPARVSYLDYRRKIMFYYTIPQSPIYHQLTLEDLLTGNAANAGLVRSNVTNTRTTYQSGYDKRKFSTQKIAELMNILGAFVLKHKDLYEIPDRHKLYNSFKIPKHSGGLRQIDAPLPELKSALYELKDIFEMQFGALYHTSAFAYVKGRDTISSVKRHQANNSNWFLKTDLTDFFGSTTKEFVMQMLEQIFPFNLVCEYKVGREMLEKALDLAFLDGGLPQGTPLSPMLTNLIMIPVDYKLANTLHDYNGQQFIYTRYADDMLISSYKGFRFTEIVKLINDTLASFNAPYRIKDKKTRYGSRSGANWNLGVMLNKDNEITIGHEKKKTFRAMLTSYALDRLHRTEWPLEDVQHLQGLIAYYKMIEPEYVESIISAVGEKRGIDIKATIKRDLSH